MSEDWYRQTVWGPSERENFFAQLKRARKKAQYLRIQASHLEVQRPDVALELLDRYFAAASEDDLDLAQAWAQRAACELALGKPDDAVESFRRCLEREREFSNVQSNGYLAFALFVARERRRDLYDEVLGVLQERQPQAFLPDTVYRFHASLALILADLGRHEEARSHAKTALEAGNATDTGLRYHPKVGLVGDRPSDVERRLRALVDA